MNLTALLLLALLVQEKFLDSALARLVRDGEGGTLYNGIAVPCDLDPLAGKRARDE
jgi:hypothetical protein